MLHAVGHPGGRPASLTFVKDPVLRNGSIAAGGCPATILSLAMGYIPTVPAWGEDPIARAGFPRLGFQR